MVPGIGYADEDVGVDEHLAGCAAYQVQLQYDTAKASNSGTTVTGIGSTATPLSQQPVILTLPAHQRAGGTARRPGRG